MSESLITAASSHLISSSQDQTHLTPFTRPQFEMKTIAFSSLLATLPVVYGTLDGMIPGQTAAPVAMVAPSGPSPTTTPPPVLFVRADQKSDATAGTAAANYIPGLDCARPGQGAQAGVFQPYLSAHRGQQQICPYDPTQNIRYRVDYNQVGCCTESATLTNGPGGLGCCPCGSICNSGYQQMQDWYWLNGMFLQSSDIVSIANSPFQAIN
jgi:hypothetical protein